jgi:oligoendopeptidase F
MHRRRFLQAAAIGAAAPLVNRSFAGAPNAEAKPAPGKQLPARSEVPEADTWDLSSLFPNDAAWETAFTAWQKQIEGYAAFQGKLAESAESLAACIRFDLDVERAGERLGTYASLKTSQDTGNSTYQRMLGRYTKAASRAGQASSFIRPEVLAISAEKLRGFLAAPPLAPYRLLLERILRFKPHTLGEKEEKLLAMQSEMADASGRIFRQLLDADMKFGAVTDEKDQRIELSHAAFSTLLQSPDREVRRNAFGTYYEQFAAHKNTLAAALNSSVQRDVFYAKARNFPSALEAALFPDQVPVAVYDNLIKAVHAQLPALYHYYDLRRRKMKLKDIHHYDTYVPILAELRTRHTWDEAVRKVLASLEPLGSEYCGVLERGLCGRWCDRYENRGKRSGAFSHGSYDGDPYILMNYQPEVLDHVFTLAHEAGHSMHSYYSAKHQPFAYYNYTLFVAEVASTFNEQLLGDYLLKQAQDKRQRAFLINRRIDSLRATVFRQTMFAEFEKLAHASSEAGEPLTLERITGLYHELLKRYFGPDFTLDAELDLECLRVPHFYRAFYVYKYATGMSAAMALAARVTGGGRRELDDYLGFLKGGCAKDPLDLLRGAGVDMEKPDAIRSALEQFGRWVKELEGLI